MLCLSLTFLVKQEAFSWCFFSLSYLEEKFEFCFCFVYKVADVTFIAMGPCEDYKPSCKPKPMVPGTYNQSRKCWILQSEWSRREHICYCQISWDWVHILYATNKQRWDAYNNPNFILTNLVQLYQPRYICLINLKKWTTDCDQCLFLFVTIIGSGYCLIYKGNWYWRYKIVIQHSLKCNFYSCEKYKEPITISYIKIWV